MSANGGEEQSKYPIIRQRLRDTAVGTMNIFHLSSVKRA